MARKRKEYVDAAQLGLTAPSASPNVSFQRDGYYFCRASLLIDIVLRNETYAEAYAVVCGFCVSGNGSKGIRVKLESHPYSSVVKFKAF